MHNFFIDLRLVGQVWRDIQKHEDARLEARKTEIATRCRDLLSKALGEIPELSHLSLAEASNLPQNQLAELSAKVVVDVLAFVGGACGFYDAVRSNRPLTEEEKQIGEALSMLIKQVQEIVPKSETS